MSSTKIKYSTEDMLDELIKSKRLAQAYLFLGPDKELMGQMALGFAKALNCFEQGTGLKSCGKCLSCRKIENFNHPDIGHIRIEGTSRQVKIGQIRNLQKETYLKPIEANRKVYIIYDADLMTLEASNCLLKTLEEPPKDVIIVLIGLHLGNLLPTIISRCQIIKFSQMQYIISHDEKTKFIDEFLNAQDPFSSERLEFVKRLKSEQLKTVDLLLAHFRDMLVGKYLGTPHSGTPCSVGHPELQSVPEWGVPKKPTQNGASPINILMIMEELLKAKELLQSNVNSKLVADYILDSLHSLKTESRS